uniref:CFA20 domain-containing protein n=1 Tax=Cucumis sativus TaxID=3659 RepID=A0A0A0KV68_CUCSA
MFKNTFQSGFLSILFSLGSKPLQIWDKEGECFRYRDAVFILHLIKDSLVCLVFEYTAIKFLNGLKLGIFPGWGQ